jgi:hypothetical protein
MTARTDLLVGRAAELGPTGNNRWCWWRIRLQTGNQDSRTQQDEMQASQHLRPLREPARIRIV